MKSRTIAAVVLSSVRARLVAHPAEPRASDWAAHLAAPSGIGEDDAFRASTSTGRPLGSSTFVAKLEAELGRRLGRR